MLRSSILVHQRWQHELNPKFPDQDRLCDSYWTKKQSQCPIKPSCQIGCFVHWSFSWRSSALQKSQNLWSPHTQPEVSARAGDTFLVPRQVQETGTGPPPMWELEDGSYLMRGLLWRDSRTESKPEDPSSNPGCLLAVWSWVSCLTSLGLIVLIYKIGGKGTQQNKWKCYLS